MALSMFEKNFFHRVFLFARPFELAPIESESEVQKSLLTTGPMTGIMSNIISESSCAQREGLFFAPSEGGSYFKHETRNSRRS